MEIKGMEKSTKLKKNSIITRERKLKIFFPLNLIYLTRTYLITIQPLSSLIL